MKKVLVVLLCVIIFLFEPISVPLLFQGLPQIVYFLGGMIWGILCVKFLPEIYKKLTKDKNKNVNEWYRW